MKWFYTDSDNEITVSTKEYVAENKSKVDELIIETLNNTKVDDSFSFDDIQTVVDRALVKLIEDELYDVYFNDAEDDSLHISYDADYSVKTHIVELSDTTDLVNEEIKTLLAFERLKS